MSYIKVYIDGAVENANPEGLTTVDHAAQQHNTIRTLADVAIFARLIINACVCVCVCVCVFSKICKERRKE